MERKPWERKIIKRNGEMNISKRSIVGLVISSMFMTPHVVFIFLILLDIVWKTCFPYIKGNFSEDVMLGLLAMALSPMGIIFFLLGCISSIIFLLANKNPKPVKIIIWCDMVLLAIPLGISIWWQVTGRMLF